jgi:hypothetical protein
MLLEVSRYAEPSEAEGKLATDTLAGHFKGRGVVLADTVTGLIAQFAERYLLVCLLPLRR